MPRTKLTEKYCKPKAPKPDYIKALILERINTLEKTPDAVAAVMGISRSTWFVRKQQPTTTWQLGEILRLCVFLDIDLEDLRTAIRY